jgi:hypothetical protein
MVATKRADLSKLRGEQVAIAFNRHQCSPSSPVKKGELCFSIRRKPSSSSRVLGYAKEVWLEDVHFFASEAGVQRIRETGQRNVCCFVVGTLLAKRPARIAKKNGWHSVRFNAQTKGCFYDAKSGACLTSAKYARLADRHIEAFGLQRGKNVSSQRQLNPGPGKLPIYGPRRSTWLGEMGGVNFNVADQSAMTQALRFTFEQLGDVIIIDGTDDWDAPVHCRPEAFVPELGCTPVAWWDTGVSGQSISGVILTRTEYSRFRRLYRSRYGADPERVGKRPPFVRPSCGCWDGEGLAVYSSGCPGDPRPQRPR